MPWQRVTGGVRLLVRVTPRGGRDAVDGVAALSDGRVVLRARVAASPNEGAANEAVRRLVAAWLGRAHSSVSIAAGSTARLKSITLAGDPDLIEADLAERCRTGVAA